MRLRGLIAFFAVAGLFTAQAVAQDVKKLRIAGLSLGAATSHMATDLSKHGFFALPVPSDPREIQREATRAHRISAFSRKDGHTLRVGVQRGDTPTIRSLDYGMDQDIDTYELIRSHLRDLFGQPTIIHGSETSVRIAIWEIAGTDMNAEGLLTTGITLVRDPVEGHSLTVRELRVRPEFLGRSRRPTINVGATE